MFKCYAVKFIAQSGIRIEDVLTGAWRVAPEKPIKGINYISQINYVSTGLWAAEAIAFMHYSQTIPAGAVEREYARLLEQDSYATYPKREVRALATQLIADRTPWATKMYVAILVETDGVYNLFVLGAPEKVSQDIAKIIGNVLSAEEAVLPPVLGKRNELVMRNEVETYGFVVGSTVEFANAQGEKVRWANYEVREPNDLKGVIADEDIVVTGVSAVAPNGMELWLTGKTVFGVTDLADHNEGVMAAGNKFFTDHENADAALVLWVEALLDLADDLFPEEAGNE